MKDSFENIKVDEILSYLIETKLYKKYQLKPDQDHTE